MTNNRVIEIKDVKLDTLKAYKGNPRIGSIEAIAESLDENKQYKPIVVNKKDNSILAGNHTWLAAKSLGWDTISVAFVDVDDESASKIVLADNRTNDLATYDTSQLANLLQNVSNPVGTGYTEQDVSLIVDAVDRSLSQTFDSLTSTDAGLDTYVEGLSNPQGVNISVPDTLDIGDGLPSENILSSEDEEDLDGFDDNEELEEQIDNSIMLIDEEKLFLPTNNRWDIPELRRDMLLEKLPQPLDTWGGRDATPDDGITYWLWNYGLARPIGMPYERAIMSFFTYDNKFFNFITHTGYMIQKVLAAGIKTAVVPDFSFYYTEPKAFHLQSVYNAQWLGRMFQETGMKVIPRVQFADEQSMDIAMLGIPKNPPILAICLQNIDAEEGNPKRDTREKSIQVLANCTKIALDALQPEHLLIYGGNPGHNLVKERVKPDMPVTYLDNFAAKRRGVVYDKKDGKDGEMYDPLKPGSKPKHIED